MAIFSFVTGYVCALKPLKLARANEPNKALASVSRSAFRRLPRLWLPATIATVIAWLLCEMGAFEVANHCDSGWMVWSSPDRQGALRPALWSLMTELKRTWTEGQNQYDGIQWTLPYFLKGSMQVYVFVVATVTLSRKWRMLASFCVWVYFWMSSECRLSRNLIDP